MKLSLSTFFFYYHTLSKEIIEIIAKSDFRYIEIWGMTPHLNYEDIPYCKELKKVLDDYNIRVVSFHSPFYINLDLKVGIRNYIYLSSKDKTNRDKAIEEIKKLIICAEIFKSNILVLHSGLDRLEHSQDCSLPILIQSLNKIIKSNPTIKFAFENELNEWTNISAIIKIVKAFNNKNVGICLDVGHSHKASNIVSDINESKDWLFSIHASDNNGDRDSHSFPFEGTIQWKEILKTLKDIKFKGPFNLEIRDKEKGNVENLNFYSSELAKLSRFRELWKKF